jgi:hypothetical protein
MQRNSTTRRQAMTAARELIESLDLPEAERVIVLALAIDRYESIRRTIEEMGATGPCVSAVLAAALEYSEAFTGE